MAESKAATNTTLPIPNYAPGVLCGVEYFERGKVELTPQQERAFKNLLTKLQTREQAPRRQEIIDVWKKRLYDRGFQHLLPMRQGGWTFPPVGSGYNPQDEASRSMFITNIYSSYREIITSVLTREVPKAHWDPDDPNSDVDITAAESAEKCEDRIDRDQQMKAKMEDTARYLWTDGRAILFATYQLDAQRFGLETEEPDVVPEDEADEDEEEEDESDETERAEETGESGEDEAERSSGGGDREEEEASGKPRGQIVTEVDGALEWQLPMKAECLAECQWARRSKEIDLQLAKARYPDVADKLRPSEGGPGGDDIDRLARINVRLGVMDNFNSTDNQVFDVTEQRTFFRRAALLEIEDLERDEIIKLFPRGAYVIFCGETFCAAYDASMDEHLSLVFAKSGDGIHRPGIGDWLVSVQDVLNNWMELANDYFTRGVPNKWMDNEMFNVQALRNQTNVPGSVHPFDREPGVTMEQVIWEETPIAFPEQLTVFIEMFRGPLAQLLSGAIDALSGAGDSSPTDTMGGMIIARDLAIARIGLPWRRIKEAIVRTKYQQVKLLAENSDQALRISGSQALTIEMKSLRGNFYAYPDVDENFPLSHTERQNQLAKLFADAVTNPALGELLFTPDNLEVFQQVNAMDDFTFQIVASRDKQLGEAQLLLEEEAEPNPKVLAAQTALKALQAEALKVANMGGQPDPADVQKAQQLQALIKTLPPMVSSEPVGYFDDHATELWVCVKILMSPKGREMRHGSEEEVRGIENLELHAKEHEAALEQKQSKTALSKAKVSFSANAKDQPPKEAAAILTAGGIPADPKDFADQDVEEAVAKHPGPGGVVTQ